MNMKNTAWLLAIVLAPHWGNAQAPQTQVPAPERLGQIRKELGRHADKVERVLAACAATKDFKADAKALEETIADVQKVLVEDGRVHKDLATITGELETNRKSIAASRQGAIRGGTLASRQQQVALLDTAIKEAKKTKDSLLALSQVLDELANEKLADWQDLYDQTARSFGEERAKAMVSEPIGEHGLKWFQAQRRKNEL